MLVRCPKCGKKLKVQDEKIGESGMKFRCPACTGIFLVRKPAAVPPAPPPEPEERTPEVPEQEGVRDERESLLSGFGGASPEEESSEDSEGGNSRLENPLDRWGSEAGPEPQQDSGKEALAGTFGLGDPFDGQEERAPMREPEPVPVGDSASQGSFPSASHAQAQPAHETFSEEAFQTPEDASRQEVVRARRLARTIMSDIALYHLRMVEDSIRNDTFFDVMGDEIREGMKLYNSRISPEVRATSDFYREAVEEYYQRRRAELAGF